MEDNKVLRRLAAKLYVLHDHLQRYDPSAPIEGDNGDMFIRYNDLLPILKEAGLDLTPESATGIVNEEDIEEAMEELQGHTYCLTREGEEPTVEGILN